MRIRLHGTEGECRRAAGRLATVLDVLDTSRPHPDRPPSRLVRIYLSANPPATTHPHTDALADSVAPCPPASDPSAPRRNCGQKA